MWGGIVLLRPYYFVWPILQDRAKTNEAYSRELKITVKRNKNSKGAGERWEQTIQMPRYGSISLVRAVAFLKSHKTHYKQTGKTCWGDHNRGDKGWKKLLFRKVKIEKKKKKEKKNNFKKKVEV